MQKYWKTLITVAMSCILIIWAGHGIAATLQKQSGVKGAASSDQAQSNQNRVRKTAAVVKKIAGNVLYLEGNKRYDLNGVNVIDARKARPASHKKKTIAELMFVNGALKETVLR